MKKTIITILLAIATSMTAIAQSPSTLPMWERKSAPAVILGRYVDWKRGDNPYPSYLGNHESLKGGDFPECVIDSINGTFTLTWDICYPLRHRFMNGLTILLFPVTPSDSTLTEVLLPNTRLTIRRRQAIASPHRNCENFGRKPSTSKALPLNCLDPSK